MTGSQKVYSPLSKETRLFLIDRQFAIVESKKFGSKPFCQLKKPFAVSNTYAEDRSARAAARKAD